MSPEPRHEAACAQAQRLFALLQQDALDAAIDAGLMQFAHDACPYCPVEWHLRVTAVQQQLQGAWDARTRYQARAARLARRADERARARLQRHEVTATHAPAPPALPPAVAAALARAKAKAAGRAT